MGDMESQAQKRQNKEWPEFFSSVGKVVGKDHSLIPPWQNPEELLTCLVH